MNERQQQALETFKASLLADNCANATYSKEDVITTFLKGYNAKERGIWHPLCEPPKHSCFRVWVTNGEDVCLCDGDNLYGGRIEMGIELGFERRAIFIIKEMPEDTRKRFKWCDYTELLKSTI
ncbi:MAG: hypothetical protein IJ064_05890 [Bacteroidaceae bacterium]|nr:hypothetical protein [Bacteroidaceae bacterium]